MSQGIMAQLIAPMIADEQPVKSAKPVKPPKKRKKYYERATRDVPNFVVADEDWPKLLHEIWQQGFRKSAIARSLNVGYDLVHSIFEGFSPPSYKQGLFLLKLHAHAMQLKRLEEEFEALNKTGV